MSFEEIYRQNYNIVYGYLINLCKNASLAEELTAQTFFKALILIPNKKQTIFAV
ncbi:MAG: hypothetical protein ACI4HL_01025 [Ruminococcus sp.]